jgi:hypothetical protein
MGSGYSEHLPFSVIPLRKYDIIIGKQWGAHYKPSICMWSNKLKFSFHGKVLTMDADVEREELLIRKGSFLRCIRCSNLVFVDPSPWPSLVMTPNGWVCYL